MAEERPRHRVVFLPGVIMPAELAYADLVGELGEAVEPVVKELALYAGDEPPDDYAIDHEIDDVLRAAEEAGFDRFHLVGYSGGGAVSLAFCARHPERLLSLALMEPAWDGNWELTPAERELWDEFERMLELDPSDESLMGNFIGRQLKPGVEPPPPPPGPPPPWMAKRPLGIKALCGTFYTETIDPEALRGFDLPVYFSRGGLSNPDYWAAMSARLAGVFPNFTEEVYPERHHFDPPHRAEPTRQAAALLAHWDRA